jgi:hypothetical protein
VFETTTDLETQNAFNPELAGHWSPLVVARAYASAGEEHLTLELLRRAASQGAPGAFRIMGELGFIDEALGIADASEPDLIDYMRFDLAEGVAMTGNVAMVEEVIAKLDWALSPLGHLALAEAYRQAGNSEAARQMLDNMPETLDGLPGSGWHSIILMRKARGYAVLGDIETTMAIMEEVTNHGEQPNHWTSITPFIACYDFELALELLRKSELRFAYGDNTPLMDAELIEVLVAASASGHGEAAYAYVGNNPNLLDRTIGLMAITIGLLQDFHTPDDTVPCSTLPLAVWTKPASSQTRTALSP